MQTPRSQFVRNKIKGLAFTAANVGYIKKLLRLEHYVVHGPRSFAEAMSNRSLREAYPLEHEAILRELRPADFDRIRASEARRERELAATTRRSARAQREQVARERALWRKLGGAT